MQNLPLLDSVRSACCGDGKLTAATPISEEYVNQNLDICSTKTKTMVSQVPIQKRKVTA
jgi:hypothetical protein